MFEEMTFSKILKKTLDRVSEKYDKRQGAIIYDAVAPICAELAQFYLDLERILDEGFADTASRKYLIKRAKERGIYPYKSTPAIILAKLEGEFNLNGGERFNFDEINYIYTGEMEQQYYKLKCEKLGNIGNVSYGELLPIENINGLEKASIVKIFTPGKEEEDTEDFRKRYFESFHSKAFGGNKMDYILKINSLNEIDQILENGGIGGCKVYRVHNGGGTVKVLITNLNYEKPTKSLIDLVQQKIDPLENTGSGEGIAPIGHFVTIEPVETKNIDISFQLDLKPNLQLEQIKSEIEEKIDNYIKNIAKNWQNEDGLIIRISHIESSILEIDGVIDIKNTEINGNQSNLFIPEEFIPIRRQINVS